MRSAGFRLLAERLTFNGGVEQSESGLFVVKDESKHWDEAMTLRVVSVGTLVTAEVKPGDVVITRGMAGADVVVDGTKYISLHEDDLLAVVADDALDSTSG